MPAFLVGDDSSSSSDEDDLDLLFLETGFAHWSRQLESKLHFEDLSELQCEEMFR